MSYLIVPGWQNSGKDHWQTHWAESLGCPRVEQDDWETPLKQDWIECLDKAVQQMSSPPILIAHSLGCTTTILFSETCGTTIRGAFLVAPPNLETPDLPKHLRNFLPIPLKPLRFPAHVVASENDPFCEFEKAREWANAWGAGFSSGGKTHHIGSLANVGDWAAGRETLKKFELTL